ncbi:MAG TPA: flagellar hook-basal body protein [Solirubrobacterales bacterium]|nr:flagellar hook-basal body protein [Solirubrobacterales bacterium]
MSALYTAAAGMEAQQNHLDQVANDLANVSTTGYKSLRVGFHDLVYQLEGRGAGPGVMTGAGAASGVIGRNPTQGALIPTERPLDVALEGPGFIQVRGPGGEVALTRDGDLQVNADGYLQTSSGQLLQPPIKVPKGVEEGEISIASNGTVSAAGRRLGQISVVAVTNPDGLQPVGENVFRPTAASGPVGAAGGTALQQGALEASNVDMADASVEMMNAQRGYELDSRVIQTQDEVLAVANGIKQ